MEDIAVKTEPVDSEIIISSQDFNEQVAKEYKLSESNESSTGSFGENALPFDQLDDKNIGGEALDSPPEPNFHEIGEFCFESDHLALKSNIDYKNLLEAIVILEAQRTQAITDLDLLMKCQEEALEDPIKFVELLQKKEMLNIPAPQKIHKLPSIDWAKYSLSGVLHYFRKKQASRFPTILSRDLDKSDKTIKSEESKQKSGQYWTAEEQKKLEELLVKFPPEEVEARRWQKIANCLENRTPIQVASRVQKYFIKLLKAGMPIPGRMPGRRSAYLKKPRRNVIRQTPSTFLVSHQPPVYMPDADEDFRFSQSQPQINDENSSESKMDLSDSDEDDDNIDSSLYGTPEFEELKLLQQIKKEKLKSSGLTHIGYQCCRCKMEPITGVRWHCTICKPESIDFCSQCFESEYEVGQHTSQHYLESIHHASTAFLDRDYMHFLGGSDYNYLDPNYMPAT